MRANRSSGTGPERALLAALRRQGLRPAAQAAIVGTPDFAWRAARVAAFVDGCFWHGCPRHGSRPRIHRAYWAAKFAANRRRDRRVDRRLRAAGWLVLRVWEHAIRADPDHVAATIRAAVARRRAA